jgi:hypothetical protein
MAYVRSLVIAAACIGATGCSLWPWAKPGEMDIDFVRGCWVQKESPGGKIQAFLRLLPDEDRLTGQMADVSTGDWITSATFSFARSGESATFEARDMPDQPEHTRIDPTRLAFDWARPQSGGQLVAYAGPTPSRNFLFAEGGNDRLAIWAVSAEPDATLVFKLFDGERDGCD